MYLDLLLLSVIICFIVDISGAMRKFKKPLSCSLCMNFHCGILYLLFTKNFSIIGIAYVSFLSMMSSVITGLLLCIKEIFNWILIKITPR